MQSYLLLSPLPSSSSSFTCSISTLFPGFWCWSSHISRGGLRNKFRPISASVIYGKNRNVNYYTLLGISRNASTAEVKKAYRLLARKYHPDVSKDLQAGELFKNIHAAYEALSNDVTRAQYDRELRFEQSKSSRNWLDFNFQHTQQPWATRTTTNRTRSTTYYAWGWSYTNVEVSDNQREVREPFSKLLLSILLMNLCTKIFGFRLGLTLCALSKFFNGELDGVYKMGYAVSCFMGGQAGIFLMVCISIASWVCPKTDKFAHLMVAMWVGSMLSRHLFVPQGALLALMHMSMKIQVHPRWWEWWW